MAAPKLTPDQRNDIARRYSAGEAFCDLAKEFKITEANAYRLCKRRGAHIRHDSKNKLTHVQKEEIVRRYVMDRKGTTTLGRVYGVKDASIRSILIKRGVKMRTISEGVRRLSIDEKAFSQINENSAYWVGFLMADGCIGKNGTRISLRLASKDKKHIYKFRKFLNGGQQVRKILPAKCFKNSMSTGSYVYEVSSKNLCNDLARFGVLPRKSFTAEVIGLEYNRDFWRGCIDGDGSIGFVKSKTAKSGILPVICFCGGIQIVSQFRKFCTTICPEISAKINKHKNIYTINIGGKRAKTIVRILYKNSNTFLDRKYSKAMKMMADHPYISG